MSYLPDATKTQWDSVLRTLDRYRAKAPNKITVHNALSVLLFLGIVALYVLLKGVLFQPSTQHTLVVMAIASVFFYIRYDTMPRAFRIMLRSLMVLFTLYAVSASNNIYPPPTGGIVETLGSPRSLRAIAVIFGVLGLLRPTLGLPAIFYVIWQNARLEQAFGFPISFVDYIGVAEFGILLIIGLIVFAHISMRQLVEFFSSPGGGEVIRRLGPLDILLLGATAIHLGNYFWSGIAKVMLDGGPLSWVMENKTQYSMLASLAADSLPISYLPSLVGWSYQIFGQAYMALNAVIVIGQLLAIILILRLRWLMAGLLFFLLMHLVIFATTGVFFWKWVWLNAALVLAVRAMPSLAIPRIVQVMLLLLVLLGKHIFFVGELGWYDTRAGNFGKLYAVTQSGQEIAVPSNYFMAAAKPIAQMGFVNTEGGNVSTGTWGTTDKIEIMRSANDCALSPESSPQEGAFSGEQLERFVRRHHAYVLERTGDGGTLYYDLYPHHVWSMPWAFMEFHNLDKREIVKYRWETQALCLDFKEGKLESKVLGLRGREITLGE